MCCKILQMEMFVISEVDIPTTINDGRSVSSDTVSENSSSPSAAAQIEKVVNTTLYTEQQFFGLTQRLLHDAFLLQRARGRVLLSLSLQIAALSSTAGSSTTGISVNPPTPPKRMKLESCALLRGACRDFKSLMPASSHDTPTPSGSPPQQLRHSSHSHGTSSL